MKHSDPAEQYLDLKRRRDEAIRQADRDAGALREATERMHRETGCESLEQLERRLATMEGKLSKAEKRFAEALAAFREKWEGNL